MPIHPMRLALVCVSLLATSYAAAAVAGEDVASDPLHESKYRERCVVDDLADTGDADFVAVQSGKFSEAATWHAGVRPQPGSFVWIPADIVVEVERDESAACFETMRVDGELRFSPSARTGLRVVTLVVGETGLLRMGTRENPIRNDFPATLTIGDRGVRDRASDPMDISGGVICLGRMEIEGEPVTSVAHLDRTPKAGDRELLLASAPQGWRAGDEILVPGTSFERVQDELVRISRIDGGRVVLDQPLVFDRWMPEEVGKKLPVGHMTRSVRIFSENRSTDRRGHIMVMHQETGHQIRYARIDSLGRTRAAVTQTIPTLDEAGQVVLGSDANTLGRYALHFHIRNGGSPEIEPNVVEGCVVTDARKHGIVNHGGNLVARANVTFNIDGSHLFSENGTETGAFEGNLCVRSAGSGDRITSRDGARDFGHGGHGIWVESPLIAVNGNWCFGHADSAIAFHAKGVPEDGQDPRIPAEWIGIPGVADSVKWVQPQGVPIFVSENYGAGCGNGMVLWDVQANPHHDVWGKVSDSAFWSIRDRGLWIPYAKHMNFERVTLVRGGSSFQGVGVLDNKSTEDIAFRDIVVKGFAIGMTVPRRGATEVARATMGNVTNFQFHSPYRHARNVRIDDPKFIPLPGLTCVDYFFEPVRLPHTGNLAALLLSSELTITGDPRLEGRQLYFPEQAPDHVAVFESGRADIDGKTNEQLWSEFRLAVGGSVAPHDASTAGFTNGLVGRVSPRAGQIPDDAWPAPLRRTGEPMYIADAGQGEGWFMESVPVNGQDEKMLYYVDATPGYVDLDPRMPREIHPDDLDYGVEVRTFMYDKVGEKVVVGNGVNIVPASMIERNDDGTVSVPYTVCDRAGHEATYLYRFRVSEDAPRRLRNISFFRQASAVGAPSEGDMLFGPLPQDNGYYLEHEEEDDADESQDHSDPYP